MPAAGSPRGPLPGERRLLVWRRASPFSCGHVPQHGVVQHRLGQELLQPSVLVLQRSQTAGFRYLQPAVLRLPLVKGCLLTPCLRQTSAVFAPASCSRSTAMICSSVNLVRFIVCPPSGGRTLPKSGGVSGAQVIGHRAGRAAQQPDLRRCVESAGGKAVTGRADRAPGSSRISARPLFAIRAQSCVLRGGMSAAERKASDVALRVADDQERLILATGRYIGEGFDDPRLDALFLTMPISWKGTLAQYVGRLHRQHARQTEEVLVVDYVDDLVPILARMAAKRRSGYRALGYTVE